MPQSLHNARLHAPTMTPTNARPRAPRAPAREAQQTNRTNTADRATTNSPRASSAANPCATQPWCYGAGERAADGGTYPYRYPYTPLLPSAIRPLGATRGARGERERERGQERARDELLHTALHTALVAPCPVRACWSPARRARSSARARREPGKSQARSQPDPGPMPARLAGAGGAQRERRSEPPRGPLAVEVEEAGEGGGEHRDGDE